MRHLLCLLMVLLLPLQGFAVQGSARHGDAYDIAHALNHANNVSHHHDADGAIHYDQSDKSVQHASDPPPLSHAAILPSTATDASAIASRLRRQTFAPLLIPDGIMSLPMRPPSRAA